MLRNLILMKIKNTYCEIDAFDRADGEAFIAHITGTA